MRFARTALALMLVLAGTFVPAGGADDLRFSCDPAGLDASARDELAAMAAQSGGRIDAAANGFVRLHGTDRAGLADLTARLADWAARHHVDLHTRDVCPVLAVASPVLPADTSQRPIQADAQPVLLAGEPTSLPHQPGLARADDDAVDPRHKRSARPCPRAPPSS